MDKAELLTDARYATAELHFCAEEFDEHRRERAANEAARIFVPPVDDDSEFLFLLDQLREKELEWVRSKRNLAKFKKGDP